jgi:hypothetical protein
MFIGLDPKFYKGHSFHIGAATSAAAKGIPLSVIQNMGRWKFVITTDRPFISLSSALKETFDTCNTLFPFKLFFVVISPIRRKAVSNVSFNAEDKDINGLSVVITNYKHSDIHAKTIFITREISNAACPVKAVHNYLSTFGHTKGSLFQFRCGSPVTYIQSTSFKSYAF